MDNIPEEVLTVEHRTSYAYSNERMSCMMLLCLKPLSNTHQRLEAFDLLVEPMTQAIEYEDFLGNSRHMLNIHRPHNRVMIKSKSLVSLQNPTNHVAGGIPASHSANDYGGYAERWDYEQPSVRTRWSSKLEAFVNDHCLPDDKDFHDLLRRLEQAIAKSLNYQPKSTTVETTIDEVLDQGEGVCQDFAHIMLAVARQWRIPSRYVLGYLCPDDRSTIPSQETHAWIECQLPDLGWVRFDPTNPTLQNSSYVTVAYGRDFEDVCPTKGLNMGSGDEELKVEVDVTRL